MIFYNNTDKSNTQERETFAGVQIDANSAYITTLQGRFTHHIASEEERAELIAGGAHVVNKGKNKSAEGSAVYRASAKSAEELSALILESAKNRAYSLISKSGASADTTNVALYWLFGCSSVFDFSMFCESVQNRAERAKAEREERERIEAQERKERERKEREERAELVKSFKSAQLSAEQLAAIAAIISAQA